MPFRLAPLLQRFLPTSLVVVLKEEGSDTMLNLFDGESDTPELIWDSSMRSELRTVTSRELDECMKVRRDTGIGNESLNLDPSVQVKYTKLQNELFIGGVYVTRFLKEPTYNIRDPTSFLEMLLQRWTHELQMCTEGESVSEEKQSTDVVLGGQDNLQSVTDAIVYLCKIRTNLCDKLAAWGYMSRCLSFLDKILSRDLLGSPLLSVMRILHVAVNRRVNVESLIASGSNDRVHGIIAFTMRAVGDTSLHPDAGFMLEMLKKVFVDALGDLSKAPKPMSQVPTPNMTYNSSNYAMAPSPAPGEGRVRVNMGDDPLGLGSPFPTQSQPSNQQPAPPPPQQQQQQGVGFGNNNINQFNNQSSQFQQPYNVGLQQQEQPQQFQQQGMYNQQQRNVASQNIPGSFLNQNSFNRNQYPQQPVQQQQFQQPQQQPAMSSYAQRSAMAQSSQGNQQQQQFSATQQQIGTTGSMIYGQSPAGQNQQSSFTQNLQSPGFQAGYGINSSTQSQYVSNQMQTPIQQQPPPQPINSWQKSTSSPQPSTMQRNTSNGSSNAGYSGNQSPALGSIQQSMNRSSQFPHQSSLQQQQYQQVQYPQSQPQPPLTTQQPQQPFQQNTQQTQHYPQVPSYGANQQTPSQYKPRPQDPNLSMQQNPMSSNTMNQQPQVQSFQQQQQQFPPQGGPVVETVTDDEIRPVGMNQNLGQQQQVQQGPPQVTEGSGVDGRTKQEPVVEAAKMAATMQGAPGCAEGRKALLESALRCDLPTYLIESVLENSNLSRVKDPASVKVHAVELLKLLTKDPGYGMKFQLVLDTIPAWKKYVSQDHSLFITGPEQKTDYFLTDGSSSDPTKLLTQG